MSPADPLAGVADPLAGDAHAAEVVVERARDARLVLIGEASHGTHDFYRCRAAITRRLIEELGFTAVAAEADWPDAQRVNAYVHGLGADATAEESLRDFARFPAWMWRNEDVREFVEWLRRRNASPAGGARPAGFHGLDLYGLSASIEAVTRYLDEVDPEASRRARARYACFDHFRADAQAYAWAVAEGTAEDCEDAAVEQLVDLRRRTSEVAARDGHVAEDRAFAAEQNARLVLGAERYYRGMFRGRESSWNLRDRHMSETLEALMAHLGRRGEEARAVVWAHNSHLGDARATEMAARGELNLGQLVAERHGDRALRVGLTTYEGTVTAASDWDAPARRMRVLPALAESWEARFHALGGDRVIDTAAARAELGGARLERAIGVIYRPETERFSHYFEADLPGQFDLVLHIDRTRALDVLEPAAARAGREPPETYPAGT